MNPNLFKSKGQLFELDHLVFSTRGVPFDDVFVARRISGYDGMPIGEKVYITRRDVDVADADRIKG